MNLNQSPNPIKDYYILPLFVCFAIVGFWGVSSFTYILKWDGIDQYYPWRHLVSECINNKSLPLWNPYQFLGYPIHADPQSGAWYLPVWIFSLFGVYDLYSISIEFILHIFLAGWGMFLLGRSLKLSKETAIIAGVAYMFSGFFTGNSQHLTYIIAGAWLPYIFNFGLGILKNPTLKGSLLLSVSCWFMLTGGYSSFVIIIFYIFLFIFLFKTFNLIKKKEGGHLFKLITHFILTVFIICILSAPFLVSTYEMIPFFNRGDSISLLQAQTGAFTPQCLITFLFPFAATENNAFFATDLSMNNGYFGLLTFIFFLASLLNKKSNIQKMFLILGLVCLLASFGSAIPFREFLYHYFPLMDHFRFPSAFRLFFILAFVVVGTIELDKFLYAPNSKSKFKLVVLLIFCIFLFFIVYGVLKTPMILEVDFFSILKNPMTVPIEIKLFYQALIGIVFLGLMYLILLNDKFKYKVLFVLIITGLEVIISSNLNQPLSTYDINNGVESYKFTSTFPKENSIKSLPTKLKADADSMHLPFYRNTGMLYHEPHWDGNNSLLIKSYVNLVENEGIKEVINKPFIYTEDLSSNLNLTRFSPSELSVSVYSKEGTKLHIAQMYYPGWVVKVNNKICEIIPNNDNLIKLNLPKGSSKVSLQYKPKLVLASFWVSASTIIFLTVFSLIRLDVIQFVEHKKM